MLVAACVLTACESGGTGPGADGAVEQSADASGDHGEHGAEDSSEGADADGADPGTKGSGDGDADGAGSSGPGTGGSGGQSADSRGRSLDGLEEMEWMSFTGMGTGYRGTRFADESGDVQCNVQGMRAYSVAICFVPGADFAAVPLSPLSITDRPNSVGWSSGDVYEAYADYNTEPQAAVYQGDMFMQQVGSGLPVGKKLRVPVDSTDEIVECGNVDGAIVCLSEDGAHGFRATPERVEAW